MLNKAKKSLKAIKAKNNVLFTRQQKNKIKGGTGSQDVIDI